MRPCERAGTDHPSRSANYAHKNKQRRELRQDSTKRQVQVQTHSPRTRHRMVCVAHTRTRTSGRKVQKTSARRHSLSAWAENDGVSRVLHGSLRRESQLCRLPKQQRATPHGQDSENDGKAIREFNRTQYKYDPLRHMYHDTNTSDASKHNDTDTTRRPRPRESQGNKKGRQKKGNTRTCCVFSVSFSVSFCFSVSFRFTPVSSTWYPGYGVSSFKHTR